MAARVNVFSATVSRVWSARGLRPHLVGSFPLSDDATHALLRLHVTATSSSWLNPVELWFGALSDTSRRHGVFGSVPELINKIEEYLLAPHDNPKHFIWSAAAERILAEVARGRVAIKLVIENDVIPQAVHFHTERRVAAPVASMFLTARARPSVGNAPTF